MRSQSRVLSRAFLGVVAAVSFGAAGLHAVAADKPLIKLRYQQAFAPSAADMGLYTAAAKGYFKDEGIEVDIRRSQDASNAVFMVGAGEADIGASYPPDILLAADKGLSVLGIWAKFQVNPLGIVSLTDGANIGSAKDLAGKKIGLTPLPIDQLLFDFVLEKGGLTRKQLDIVNPGFNGGQMVGERKLDGASGVPWYEVAGLRTAGMNPKLLQYRDMGGLDFPFMAIIANGQYAKANAETLKGFLRALRKGEDYAKQHPAEGMDALLKAAPALDRKRQEATLAAVGPLREGPGTVSHGLGYLDMAQLQQLADFLYERKVLKTKVDAANVFTNRYR
ncbi:MAG: ABC transporter substrate-binding protein [Burkholderiaceae bacterium]